MSEISKPKQKSKYHSAPRKGKRARLEVNLKGFLCSCNGKEKDCVRESYNILNKYADRLYPKEDSPQTAGKSKQPEDELDIEVSLENEIRSLKSTEEKRFQAVDSGAKNFLFIRTTVPDPVDLVVKIIEDLQTSRNQQTKFLLRLIPVEVTCRASVRDITKAFAPLAEKHFRDVPRTFSVVFSHRNNDSLPKDELIQALADKVLECRSDHKVDLKGAELSVVVEAIRGFAFLSVVPDYLKFKKYNLLAICDQNVPDVEEATEPAANDEELG